MIISPLIHISAPVL